MDREPNTSQPVASAPWSPRRMLKRLPHMAALAVVVGAGMPGMSACSNTTSPTTTPTAGVQSILFEQRVNHYISNGQLVIDVAGGNGQVIDYTRFDPGGRLALLSPASADGVVTNLTPMFTTADFNGADVSFDASEAVFSMKTDANDSYHLYTVKLTADAAGNFELHQLTAGSQDDINPIYLPGGIIGFATNQMYTAMGTRADEYEHSRVVAQLATISEAGGDATRRLFPQNLSHSVAPFPRSDGSMGYSRWEHFGGTNDVKLFAASPGGTNMLAVAGQHGKPVNSIINVKEISPNVMIAIGTERDRTIHSGALIQIDARNQSDPFCLDASNAPFTGHQCLDEQNAQFTVLTPDVPVTSDPSPVGRYREPSVLPDGRILTSWADGPVNDLNELSNTPPDYGIYIYDPVAHTNQLVYNDRTYWDLNAVAVVAHAEPPIIGQVQHSIDESTPVLLGSVNLATTSLDETVQGAEFTTAIPLGQALQNAVAVRIIEGFSSEAAKGVEKFGLTMDEGAAVLGTAPVYPDGSWLANVPPYIMMHVQPLDKFGIAIRNQRLWIQGSPGEDRRCVGCHASRTGDGVPKLGQNPTVAEQRGPENFTEAIPDRVEYPWALTGAGLSPESGVPAANQIIPADVLNEKCGSCHNSSTTSYYSLAFTDPVTGDTTTYNIPYLDLTNTPVTVYYDEMVHTYPASYVSLFYPATLQMTMAMGGIKVTGQIPPEWMIPEDARDSVLISVLNVAASDGTTAWSHSTCEGCTSVSSMESPPSASVKFHPEDKGVTLTAAERQALIRTADLGGQFYARQNTGFVPYNADPTQGQKY
jgi:hypothetical protein